MSKKSGARGGRTDLNKYSNEARNTVDHIHKIFPAWAKEDILRALEEHRFDVDAVLDQKLNGREEWTEVKKKKTAAEIKAQKRSEQRKATSAGASQRGGRGAGRGGARVDRGGRRRGRGGLVNGESRPVHTSDDVETEQTSATTPPPEPTKSTTPAVEPQPAVPSKPSFADILKKNVQKEEPEPKTAATPLSDDQHEHTETTHRPKQQRPRRDAKPPVQEAAPEKEEEEEDVSEQLQQTPVADVEGQKIESAGELQIQKKEIENAAALAHTLQTAPTAEKGAVPVVQTQQTQRVQHQVPAPQMPTSASEAANLILPPGSTEFLQSGGSLDLQFGSMGISDEQSHGQPQQSHAPSQQQQHPQQQQQAPQANYQMPPQMPQQPQFPPHYGWTGQQYGDQGYQNFFNQYGQPQQARPHQPQQASGKDQPSSEKQDDTTKQAGYQQGSNKYVQPNPYAQMGSPQYGFPAQFGYPYMMPNAMQFQGYPQGYMPSSSKNYPFYGKQNLYGYQAYQGATGASGAQQGAYPPGAATDEAQQTEYGKSMSYPYGGGAPQQSQPHHQHQHHNPQQDQPKQQRGGNKPRRSEQSANPYAGYGGYPGNVYGGGFMNYGPAGAYPASQGYQHPTTTPYSQSGGGARQHQSGKDQDSQQQQQQQQPQQQSRQPTWNQQY